MEKAGSAFKLERIVGKGMMAAANPPAISDVIYKMFGPVYVAKLMRVDVVDMNGVLLSTDPQGLNIVCKISYPIDFNNNDIELVSQYQLFATAMAGGKKVSVSGLGSYFPGIPEFSMDDVFSVEVTP